MNLRNDLIDEISKYNVKETKSQQIDKYWNNWLIFKTKEPNIFKNINSNKKDRYIF